MSYFLVTGGCGFIGSHIAEELVRRGEKVRIFDNLSSGRLENIAAFRDRVEFVEGDIRDSVAVTAAMDGVARVFHEAALVSVFDSVNRPGENHEINITGTLNVLSAARSAGVRRVVFASSAAVYGNNPDLPKREEMKPEPVSPYAVAKITDEYYGAVFSGLYGLPVVALRYFNVYGPRQDPSSPYSGVISRFTDALRRNETPTIFGDGLQSRDFVYVKDVVAANLLAMEAPGLSGGEVYNVATGRAATLLDLLSALGKASGRRVEPEMKPARAGDIRHSLAEIDRARAALGYEPAFSLEEGLSRLWNGA